MRPALTECEDQTLLFANRVLSPDLACGNGVETVRRQRCWKRESTTTPDIRVQRAPGGYALRHNGRCKPDHIGEREPQGNVLDGERIPFERGAILPVPLGDVQRAEPSESRATEYGRFPELS